jgi:molybdopterin-guanine dinucleotide biosynthesis protein A
VKFSAVLLAGGESRRMGQDKATLGFLGKPLWQIQIELLRKLGPVKIFISARTDPTWRPNDCEFVSDEQPSRGPLSGLSAALQRMRCEHLLTLAIDMPFMREEYLRSLCEQAEPGCGILPMIDDRAEPLAAIYPRTADVDVKEALRGEDFSLQSLARKLVAAEKLQTILVNDSEREFFRNINEPADVK